MDSVVKQSNADTGMKITIMIALCGKSIDLLQDHIKNLRFPPSTLSTALLECSSLKAMFESLGVLHEQGKIPASINCALGGPDDSVLDNCTRALDDLDSLLEPYDDLYENGDDNYSHGRFRGWSHVQNLLDSIYALKAVITSQPARAKLSTSEALKSPMY
jgi:hypothetical protein